MKVVLRVSSSNEHCCHFTHNLAASGTITWPPGSTSPFLSAGVSCASKVSWKHKLAGSTKWNHNVAKNVNVRVTTLDISQLVPST